LLLLQNPFKLNAKCAFNKTDLNPIKEADQVTFCLCIIFRWIGFFDMDGRNFFFKFQAIKKKMYFFKLLCN
jgi:hypothetical protein